jgi:hypothetical protein
MSMDPFAILAQLAPRARSEEELIQMAAQLAPAPGANFAPQPQLPPQMPQMMMPQMPQQGVGQHLAMPQAKAAVPVPAGTIGEARTRPGQYF